MKSKTRPLNGDTPLTPKRVVIKVGSALLTPDGPLGEEAFEYIGQEIVKLTRRGVQVLLVSSGAIAQGRLARGLKDRPRRLSDAQALAAIGQPLLMSKWASALSPQQVAQVLLTQSDIDDRTRFLNARRALFALMEAQVIPIGNENDTVATEEIKIGDNDTLGAHVASLVSADLLILLTQVEGLYTANPERDPTAQRMLRIHPSDDVMRFAGGSSEDGWGRGGMVTKVRAAQIAGSVGIPTLIAHGRHPIRALLDDFSLGTYFEPSHPASDRFLYTWPLSGAIKLTSAGWSEFQNGRDLDLDGIEGVEGHFNRGAVVEFWFDGEVVGRGLTGYKSEELLLVVKSNGTDFCKLLGDDFDGAVCRAEDWSRR